MPETGVSWLSRTMNVFWKWQECCNHEVTAVVASHKNGTKLSPSLSLFFKATRLSITEATSGFLGFVTWNIWKISMLSKYRYSLGLAILELVILMSLCVSSAILTLEWTVVVKYSVKWLLISSRVSDHCILHLLSLWNTNHIFSSYEPAGHY